MNVSWTRLPSAQMLSRAQMFVLCAFLLFAWESNARSEAALTLLSITCAVDRRFWVSLRHSTIIWLTASLAGYILIRGAFAGLDNPGHIPHHLRDGGRLDEARAILQKHEPAELREGANA